MIGTCHFAVAVSHTHPAIINSHLHIKLNAYESWYGAALSCPAPLPLFLRRKRASSCRWHVPFPFFLFYVSARGKLCPKRVSVESWPIRSAMLSTLDTTLSTLNVSIFHFRFSFFGLGNLRTDSGTEFCAARHPRRLKFGRCNWSDPLNTLSQTCTYVGLCFVWKWSLRSEIGGNLTHEAIVNS